MKLYMKEKVFTLSDKFFVMDEEGNEKYIVEGEFLSLGKRLHIYDLQGAEVAFIKQELLTFLPRFTVSVDGAEAAQVKREFSLFLPRYTIEGLGWEIEGSFWEHDYQITRQGSPIVTIQKEWMTWGDSYELDITNPADEITALAVVLTIDCVREMQQNNN